MTPAGHAISLAAALLLGLLLGCESGGGETPAAEAVCAEHHVPEAICPFCHPGIVDPRRMCAEHGVPEALCTRCDPRLEAAFQAAGDWCGEHGLPESQCTACHPELAAGPAAPGDREPAEPRDVRVERGDAPRSQRPPSVTCDTETLRVVLASPEILGIAGIETVTVARRPVSRTLAANAILAYDGNRLVHLAPRVSGIVREVLRDLGDRVEAGAPLAVLDSVDLGAAKAAYLEGRATLSLRERIYAREQDLAARGVSTERDALEAETNVLASRIALQRAEQNLRLLGLSDAEIAAVAANGDVSPLLTLAAPFAGVVIERHAVVGEASDHEEILFSIADTSTMWAILDIYPEDADEVAPGQRVLLVVDGIAGETFGGTVTWVSTEVDPRTRTLKARAEVPNPAGTLRANLFARAEIVVRDRAETLLVPRAAVQWDGCCNIVFVRAGETLFLPRKVHLGPPIGEAFEVLSGLERGEEIVTQGSFLLKTEILRESIGAGCCDAEERE